MTPPDIPPLVGPHEAAERIDVTVHFLLEEGDALGIPCYRVGRHRKYRLDELDNWLSEYMMNYRERD